MSVPFSADKIILNGQSLEEAVAAKQTKFPTTPSRVFGNDDTGGNKLYTFAELAEKLANENVFAPLAALDDIGAPGAATAALDGISCVPLSRISVRSSNSLSPLADGYMPGGYSALWTRDYSYSIQHCAGLVSSAQIRTFVSYFLASRTTAATVDPLGGFYPADFIADRIDSLGAATYKNAIGKLPFMDGIAFIVRALYFDYKRTGDPAAFLSNKTAIDACLAALPRSANGCVYSDPATPSIDYGFTDSVLKTGDCLYGSALLALAYRDCSEMSGEYGSGPYWTAFLQVIAGLATLRHATGWYLGSSGNCNANYDVWGTALIVAENLTQTPQERRASAKTIVAAYRAGTITQGGWVRHLPRPQRWINSGGGGPDDTYQNGGYWATPIIECVAAAALVDQSIAEEWASEAVATYRAQLAAEGTVGANTAPYEWFNGSVLSTAKGYVASALALARFAETPPAFRTLSLRAVDVGTSFATDTTGDYTASGFAWNAAGDFRNSDNTDGNRFVHTAFSQADAAVKVVFSRTALTPNCQIILRYTDADNYIFAGTASTDGRLLTIYERVAGVNTVLISSSAVTLATFPVPINTDLSLSAWVVGTTVWLAGWGLSMSATASIAGAGKVGIRFGSGGGTLKIKNFACWEIPEATAPNDIILSDDLGLILPAGANTRPLFGEVRMLTASGSVIRRINAGIGSLVNCT